MALTPQQLIDRAKAAPRTLKIIAIVAAVDLVILLLAAFTLEDEVDARAAHIEQTRVDLAQLRTKIETTRREIGRLPELRQKYDAAMSDGVLADQDRQKLVTHAQQLGERHHIADFHYKLDPQQSAPSTTPAFALVTTPVSLTETAFLDSDVLEFWDEILSNLQSHYQITKATLERSDADLQTAVANIRAGRPASLVKAELEFRWVSLRKVASGANTPAAGAAPSSAPPVKAAEADAHTGQPQ